MRDPDITLSAGPTMAYPEVLAAQGKQITLIQAAIRICQELDQAGHGVGMLWVNAAVVDLIEEGVEVP